MSRSSRPQSHKRSKSASSLSRFRETDEKLSEIEIPPTASINEMRKIIQKKNKKDLVDAYLSLYSAKCEIKRDSEIQEQKNHELISDLTGERQALIDVKRDLEQSIKKLELQLQQQRQEKENIEEEKRKINEDLIKEREEYWHYVNQFAKTIQKTQGKVYITGNCKNVQVGGSNIIKDEVMSQGQELIHKLSLSNENHIAKRQELEMQIRNLKVTVKEIQDSIKEIVKRFTGNRCALLREDKELLTFLTENRSDKRVIQDGVKQMKMMKKEKHKLPLAVNAMIERMLNKFGRITCGEFVKILDGKNYEPEKDIGPCHADKIKDKQESVMAMSFPLQQFDNDVPLDRSLCKEILLLWLAITDENDSETLLGKIEAYESKLSAELISKFESELKSIDVSNVMKEMLSDKDDDSQQKGSATGYSKAPADQSLNGLPDALSQFMHQLESYKIIIDIDRKVDAIFKAMTDSNQNTRQNRPSFTSDV